MSRSSLLALFLLCLIPSFATAQVQEEERPSDDPVIEARLAKLSKELRCLQCQNQTLADSPAGLAAVQVPVRLGSLMYGYGPPF